MGCLIKSSITIFICSFEPNGMSKHHCKTLPIFGVVPSDANIRQNILEACFERNFVKRLAYSAQEAHRKIDFSR